MFTRSRPLWSAIAISSRRFLVTSRLPDVSIPTASFNDHVLANVDLYAERTAMVDPMSGRSFSYADVKSTVHRVASALTRRRFLQRQVLTIFASNCPEAVLVHHGVLAAGGAVSLVSSGATKDELVRHLSHTGSCVLVATEAHAETAMSAAAAVSSIQDVYVIGDSTPHGCRSVRELTEEDDGGASPWGQLETRPDDVVLLPHSSGTTGHPKTVMLTNRSLCANMAQSNGILDHNPGAESFIGFLPFSHIYGVFVIYGLGFNNGATIVNMESFDPQRLLENMETYRTTFLHMVPPVALFLLQSAVTEKFDLSSLQRIICGAAPLQKAAAKALVEKFSLKNPSFQLVQGYGCTEASPLITITPRAKFMPGPKHGSAGVLVPNTQCCFVNPATGIVVADGEEGEIWIRGPQVMAGYLNNPEATADTIQDGWMRTGDIGKVDADGYFFITDRVKELIKYKAHQVAPAQVEDMLLTHPGVVDCAVIGKKDERAGELPMAFVVREGDVEAEELERFVEERLSDKNRLRGGVRFVDSIPKSPSGKILRRLLRDQVNA